MAALFVGDLHPNITTDEIFQEFSSVGRVISILIRKEVVFGRSNCYAFVNFQEITDAKRATNILNLKLVKNRPIHVMQYKTDVGKVFIRDLDEKIDENYLKNVFGEFGNIVDCKVAKNHLGNSIGSAFVHFETELAAKTCIEISDGKKLGDEIIHVEKFNLLKENEEELGGKEKLVMKLKMAIRNSLFNTDEVYENPEEVGATEVSLGVKGQQQFVEKSMPSTSQFNNPATTQSQVGAENLKKDHENVIEISKEQRQILSQRIYSMVSPVLPALASNITAKLMENNTPFLLFIMEDEVAFKTRIFDLMLEIDFISEFSQN